MLYDGVHLQPESGNDAPGARCVRPWTACTSPCAIRAGAGHGRTRGARRL